MGRAHFGPGSGPIWLDDISCIGNETHLGSCKHAEWGTHNCLHSEDVGIICSNASTKLQLVAGPKGAQMGRLEVLVAQQWGTVSRGPDYDHRARLL